MNRRNYVHCNAHAYENLDDNHNVDDADGNEEEKGRRTICTNGKKGRKKTVYIYRYILYTYIHTYIHMSHDRVRSSE